jgi:hypothetical protein
MRRADHRRALRLNPLAASRWPSPHYLFRISLGVSKISMWLL